MLRACKYEIYPNEQQAELIIRTVGCARFVYNNLLDNYKQQLEDGVKPKLIEVSELKESNDFLNEVDSLALANAKQNLGTALSNFFKSRKGERKGKRVKFPKRHKKHKCKWRYTTNNQRGTVRIEGETIKLPKVGFVRIELHRPVEGEIKSCTVEATRDGKFFASIAVELSDTHAKRELPSYGELKVVGIDMSLSQFTVDSEGTEDDTKPKYVRHYRSNEKRRSRLNRQMSRKQKGSSNRDKARKRLAKLDRHIANCRHDYAHKMSRHYADTCDVIVLEDINLQGMSRTLRLGKSVTDMGFGEFRRYLAYKCEERDVAIMYADKWFASSKTCHECGCKNDNLTLSDRRWTCPHCGAELDRDGNAALNLREYFYGVVTEENYNTAGTAGIHASGDAATTLRATLVQAASMKEEAPSFRWG
jgi:putative transposase